MIAKAFLPSLLVPYGVLRSKFWARGSVVAVITLVLCKHLFPIYPSLPPYPTLTLLPHQRAATALFSQLIQNISLPLSLSSSSPAFAPIRAQPAHPQPTTMCIVFTCGEHSFRREVEGYEGLICRCYNCGNYSGHVIKTHPWFTFCFVVCLLSA